MDKGADTMQRLVIGGAILLGIIIVVAIGYSLYVKAMRAEGELANKVALDNQTKNSGAQASVSLTGEAKNASNISYDGLVQKKDDATTTPTNFEIVNENAEVEVPKEEEPIEEALPPEETPVEEPATPAKPVYNGDRPLTEAEIRAIRQLPIDDSPSGSLQTALEEESNGEYRARY